MQNIRQILGIKNIENKIVECHAMCEYAHCKQDEWCDFLEICKNCKSIMCSDCIRTDFNGCLNCLKCECYICKIKRLGMCYHVCRGCNKVFCAICTQYTEISTEKPSLCSSLYYCYSCR